MTQDNTELLPVTQEDIAIALEHLGYDSVDDLHYWAENDTELRRFDELCSRFARHRLNTRPTQGHDALVEAVTHRFLQWELPTDFNPDAGISFEPEYNAEYMAKLGKPPMRHQPVGTNLLCYDQAKAMVEHICAPILTNTPSPQAEAAPDDGLVDELEVLSGLIQNQIELNPSNYDHDDACRLNTEAVEIALMAEDLFPRILTALRARPSGDGGWQPIETAPKDGRSILCYAPGAKIPAQMQWVVFEGEGRWADDPETFCEDSHWREYWTSVRYEPTHWQPLPEPPALSTIKGEG